MFKNLIVRADATKRMGTGHIMRCMALGQLWQKSGGEVTFLSYCDNAALRHRIISEGFQLISMEQMHPDPSDFVQVLKYSRNVGKANGVSWLVLDGYHFDTDYQMSVREAGIRLLVIDDYNHLQRYCADILLNQNIGAEKISYSGNSDMICLFGPKYALLRNEFLDWKDRFKGQPSRVRNILVAMGGADPDNITLKVVRSLLQEGLKDFKVNIVVGPTNSNLKVLEHEIESVAEAGLLIARKLYLHKSANMPNLMAEADLAITAGGSTCWELCFFGIPSLVIVAAKNQQEIAYGLEKEEAFICLGWHHELTERHIQKQIANLITDKERRQAMSANALSLVDGKGPSRVLKELFQRLEVCNANSFHGK
jgi:UDP-2,4-diacetamido-2,4,6-trideoxy-beta-L-altropyranose hydrolase